MEADRNPKHVPPRLVFWGCLFFFFNIKWHIYFQAHLIIINFREERTTFPVFAASNTSPHTPDGKVSHKFCYRKKTTTKKKGGEGERSASVQRRVPVC